MTTVLLVDNDKRVLAAYERAFTEAGYTVLAAESDDEGEAIFRGDDVDLAVIDLMMQHTDAGIVLAHHFKRAKPDIPIILTSDLTSETGMVFTLASAGERKWIKADRMLVKPVRLDLLIAEADALLGKTAATPEHVEI
jgi:DNA-binding response OmpR family regulator